MDTQEISAFEQFITARLFAQFAAFAPDMSLGAALHLAHRIMGVGPEEAIDWIVNTRELMQLQLPQHCEA